MQDVAKAHAADLAIQDAHRGQLPALLGRRGKGQIFCLVEAPDVEAANTVHREAHGLVADAVYRVQEGV